MTTRPTAKALLRTTLAIASATLLGGCAITPQALTTQELSLASETVLANIDADQEPVTGQVDLYEAMARALKYNLDNRVEMFRVALAQRDLADATANLMPDLTAKAGYAVRDNVLSTQSKSLLTGLRTSDVTVSSEREARTGDLAFSFHVLDFGLSYVRARQAADQALIVEEQKRKIVNRIIEDVRTAYWRGVSAERLLDGFRRLQDRVDRAQKNSATLRRAGRASPMTALTFERELVDIKKQIRRLDLELRTAKAQLAGLMNVRPDAPFSLVVPKRDLSKLRVSQSGDELVRIAVQNRPEFREALYKARIGVREETAAILEVLPGASVFAGANYDSNDFLLNTSWLDAGVRASWNLTKLLKYPIRRRAIRARAELSEAEAEAYAMAIMTQVHMARARHAQTRRIAETAAEYSRVQDRITNQMRARATAGATSEHALIREEMNALVAAVEYDIAYADFQNAYANVYAAIGLDPVAPGQSLDVPVSDLARSLRAVWVERGDGS